MDRCASDNVYLHRDFHGALSAGIDFLHERYGAEAVREYLRQFTLACYAPLKKKLAKEGLPALKEYFEEVYCAEGGDIDVELTDNELVVSVQSCPAVTYGYKVADLFYETVKTVNESLCGGLLFQRNSLGMMRRPAGVCSVSSGGFKSPVKDPPLIPPC